MIEKNLSPNFNFFFAIVAPLPEHFQIPPSRIPGPQSLGKKEICREGWDLGFIPKGGHYDQIFLK
jgi:hypothetical protein